MKKTNTLPLALAANMSIMLFPSQAVALGLGDIALQSYLNEPFSAEVELLSLKGVEADQITASLAGNDAFDRANLPRPFFLTQLRFQPTVNADGNTVIKIYSSRPIDEPFLDFLLEIKWPEGKLLRQYTVLLDPPQLAPIKIATSKIEGLKKTENASLVSTAKAKRTSALTPKGKLSLGGRYGPVLRTDTMWNIANRVSPKEGFSVHQIMVGIFIKNPSAFGGNNLNQLKSGRIIQLPTEADMRLSARESLKEVKRHNEAFKTGQTLDVPILKLANEVPAQEAPVTVQEDPLIAETDALLAESPIQAAEAEPAQAIEAASGEQAKTTNVPKQNVPQLTLLPVEKVAPEAPVEKTVPEKTLKDSVAEKAETMAQSEEIKAIISKFTNNIEALSQRIESLESQNDDYKKALTVKDTELSELRSILNDDGLYDQKFNGLPLPFLSPVHFSFDAANEQIHFAFAPEMFAELRAIETQFAPMYLSDIAKASTTAEPADVAIAPKSANFIPMEAKPEVTARPEPAVVSVLEKKLDVVTQPELPKAAPKASVTPPEQTAVAPTIVEAPEIETGSSGVAMFLWFLISTLGLGGALFVFRKHFSLAILPELPAKLKEKRAKKEKVVVCNDHRQDVLFNVNSEDREDLHGDFDISSAVSAISTEESDEPAVQPQDELDETDTMFAFEDANEEEVIETAQTEVPESVYSADMDVLTEVEIYIAYGHNDKAQEKMEEYLVNHMDCHEVLMKLLESYCSTKSKDKFLLYFPKLPDTNAFEKVSQKKRLKALEEVSFVLVSEGRFIDLPSEDDITLDENDMNSLSADEAAENAPASMDVDDLMAVDLEAQLEDAFTDLEDKIPEPPKDESALADEQLLAETAEEAALHAAEKNEELDDTMLEREIKMAQAATIDPSPDEATEAPTFDAQEVVSEAIEATPVEDLSAAEDEFLNLEVPEPLDEDAPLSLDMGSDPAESADNGAIEFEAVDLPLPESEEEEGSLEATNLDDLSFSDFALEPKNEAEENGEIVFDAPPEVFDVHDAAPETEENKLDLVHKHLDLGKDEEARRLLDDIMAHGDPEQQLQAQSLIDRLK